MFVCVVDSKRCDDESLEIFGPRLRGGVTPLSWLLVPSL
jgi:hypothetical protein